MVIIVHGVNSLAPKIYIALLAVLKTVYQCKYTWKFEQQPLETRFCQDSCKNFCMKKYDKFEHACMWNEPVKTKCKKLILQLSLPIGFLAAKIVLY